MGLNSPLLQKGGGQIITAQFNKISISISTSFQRGIFAEQNISQNSLAWVSWVTFIVTSSSSCSRFSISAILSSNSLLLSHRPCELKEVGVLVLSNVTASVILRWPKCTTMALKRFTKSQGYTRHPPCRLTLIHASDNYKLELSSLWKIPNY